MEPSGFTDNEEEETTKISLTYNFTETKITVITKCNQVPTKNKYNNTVSPRILIPLSLKVN